MAYPLLPASRLVLPRPATWVKNTTHRVDQPRPWAAAPGPGLARAGRRPFAYLAFRTDIAAQCRFVQRPGGFRQEFPWALGGTGGGPLPHLPGLEPQRV